jgi:hypothetical protein
MLEQAEAPAERELTSGEILRSVQTRYRICNYLFKASAAWMLAGMALLILSVLFSVSIRQIRTFFWFAEAIAFSILTIAFVLTLAIYRCPVCDTFLGRFRPSEEFCPGCDAQVKSTR